MNKLNSYFQRLFINTGSLVSEKLTLSKRTKLFFWIGGLFAFLWIIVRSGTNPKRLMYPCQKAAFPLASAWFVAVISILGGTILWKLVARIGSVAMLVIGLGWFMFSGHSSSAPSMVQMASSTEGLPVWQVSSPTSELFVLDNIPTTPGSLNAANASVPDSHLPDPAMDSLFMVMDSQNLNIYKTASTPNGLVSSDEIVVIKANFQWRQTLSTNTDRIKGLIWKILQHPDGFTGEILVCENHQNSGDHDLTLCNNSDDLNQTILDVISTFKAKGYPVDLVLWSEFNDVVVTEYSDGNYTDGYTWNATTMVSYPKFTSPGGANVSLKHGIWNSLSSTYNRDALCVINFPVAKAHGWVGATLGIKNWLGTLSAAYSNSRYGGSDAMHCNYWFSETALPARVMAEAYPDLTIIDATWVAPRYNHIWEVNNQIRMDMLVASTDPVAASYYTAKYILNPVAESDRRTDPDNTDNSGSCAGFSIPYSVVFDNWTNYLINTAGMNYTRDTLEMSVYSRESLTSTPVSTINVTSEGNATAINVMDGTLQLHAEVLPANATNRAVNWTINNSSIASISPNGLLTASGNGTVVATATAVDGSGVFDNISITLSNQDPIPVSSIEISSAGNATEITTDNGTLQFSANVFPGNATNSSITWSVNKPALASINQSGLLTAIDDGPVTVIATANDGSGITDEFSISISNQNVILVTYITLSSEGDVTVIDTDEGTLQLYSQVLPDNASNDAVTWSVDDTDIASVNQNGLLSAIDDGNVTVTATANDGSGISGNIVISISNQNLIPASSIIVTSEGNRSTITSEAGTLQMYSTVLPSDATDRTTTWSVSDNSIAGISSGGLLTAYDDGTVSVIATANDGSGVTGKLSIEISNQNPVLVTGISITSENNATTIDTKSGELQMYAEASPSNATNKSVTWSVNNAYNASISETGLLTAINDGAISVIATANDGSGISNSFDVTISNQNPIPVSSIILTSENNSTTITENGSTIQLYAEVLPSDAFDNSITWSVSDPTLAGINQNGMMIAYDNGVVTAIATANDGSGTYGEFDVHISNQNLILITSINISATDNITEIDTKNGQLQLNAEILPENATNNSIRWSVNNQAMAYISQTGLLTAYHDGTVIASAFAEDGSEVFGTITIDISGQDHIAVEEITVYSENNETIINQDNGLLQLRANIHPENASNTNISWKTSNTRIASINENGILTAISDGTVKAYAIAVENPEVSDSLSIVIQNQTTSVSNGKEFEFRVFPNPANNKVYIQQKFNEPYIYSLSNMSGVEVINLQSADEVVKIDVSRFPEGIYLLHIKNNNNFISTRKIVIEH